MRTVSRTAGTFAVVAFLLVLAVDAVLSLVYQPPPTQANRNAFLAVHGTFHGAVLLLSSVGALVGFALVRQRLPTTRQTIFLAVAYGLTTVLAGVGSFMLAGSLGAAAWLVMGSIAFALGSVVFTKPWRQSGS